MIEIIGLVMLVAGLTIVLVYFLPYMIPSFPAILRNILSLDQMIIFSLFMAAGGFIVYKKRPTKNPRLARGRRIFPESIQQASQTSQDIGDPTIEQIVKQTVAELLGPRLVQGDGGNSSLFEQALSEAVKRVGLQLDGTLKLADGTELKLMGKDWLAEDFKITITTKQGTEQPPTQEKQKQQDLSPLR